MRPLEALKDFDRLLGQPIAIVFKHSTACGLSARAHREAERFLETNPERHIYKVEVIEFRRVSDYIESKTGVRHASPQLLVLKRGEVVWHGSHARVTAEAIAAAAS